MRDEQKGGKMFDTTHADGSLVDQVRRLLTKAEVDFLTEVAGGSGLEGMILGCVGMGGQIMLVDVRLGSEVVGVDGKLKREERGLLASCRLGLMAFAELRLQGWSANSESWPAAARKVVEAWTGRPALDDMMTLLSADELADVKSHVRQFGSESAYAYLDEVVRLGMRYLRPAQYRPGADNLFGPARRGAPERMASAYRAAQAKRSIAWWAVPVGEQQGPGTSGELS